MITRTTLLLIALVAVSACKPPPVQEGEYKVCAVGNYDNPHFVLQQDDQVFVSKANLVRHVTFRRKGVEDETLPMVSCCRHRTLATTFRDPEGEFHLVTIENEPRPKGKGKCEADRKRPVIAIRFCVPKYDDKSELTWDCAPRTGPHGGDAHAQLSSKVVPPILQKDSLLQPGAPQQPGELPQPDPTLPSGAPQDGIRPGEGQ